MAGLYGGVVIESLERVKSLCGSGDPVCVWIVTDPLGGGFVERLWRPFLT